jgi:nitroreductase
VQRAPSAINRQPWRLIFAQSMMALISVSKGAGLDLGIAMAHWSIAAQEEKLPGAWNLAPDRERLTREMQIPPTVELVAVWE